MNMLYKLTLWPLPESLWSFARSWCSQDRRHDCSWEEFQSASLVLCFFHKPCPCRYHRRHLCFDCRPPIAPGQLKLWHHSPVACFPKCRKALANMHSSVAKSQWTNINAYLCHAILLVGTRLANFTSLPYCGMRDLRQCYGHDNLISNWLNFSKIQDTKSKTLSLLVNNKLNFSLKYHKGTQTIRDRRNDQALLRWLNLHSTSSCNEQLQYSCWHVKLKSWSSCQVTRLTR